METRHEACSAEGQPRNILDCNPNRFAGRCPALSRCCHCVIHSCYAFFDAFRADFHRRTASDDSVDRFFERDRSRDQVGDDIVACDRASAPLQG